MIFLLFDRELSFITQIDDFDFIDFYQLIN